MKSNKVCGCLADHARTEAIVCALEVICHSLPSRFDCSLARRFNAALERGELLSAVSDTYLQALRSQAGTNPGVVFTPTWLAEAAVERLVPGRAVVDLGAGTGSLSFAAAAKGYEVFAIESERTLVRILGHLVHLLGFEDQIKVVEADAFAWDGPSDSQIISNPPYTRHHRIPFDKKKELREFARRSGIDLPGTSSLYAFFMVAGLSAEWSTKEVFIVPTNWMEAKYGAPLRRYLPANADVVVEVVGTGNNGQIFEGYSTTACIVSTSRENLAAKSVRIGLLSEGGTDAGARTTSLPKSHWAGNWLSICLGGRNALQSEGVELGELFQVHRGIATGANDFFMFSIETATSQNIPEHELTPVIRSFGNDGQSPDLQLLWTPSDMPSEASLSHICKGEEAGVQLRWLCSNRNPWWRIKLPKAAPYLVTSMGRNLPIIFQNTDSALNLNNIHGLTPRPGVPTEMAEAAISFLRQTEGLESLLSASRHLGQGLWKLEPSDVKRAVVRL